ncbi:beta strand repeat-containing protein, partial [Hymenobacter sp. IS2118]|uniref:beta strand repeat-containing protein n=1 Tax=Hymenobacter sp. IS2118 TaxID=1505605 RepID=UPI0013765A7C
MMTPFTMRRPTLLGRLLGFGLLALSPLLGQAQTAFTGTYPFTSVTSSSGNVDPTDPIATVPGVTFGSFASTVAGNSSAGDRFSLANWPLNTTAPGNNALAFDANPDAGKYYTVTLTPKKGTSVQFSLTGITFTLRRSGTGIRQYVVRSSADAFAANLPASIAPANANLSVVATNVFQVTDASTGDNLGSTVTLSGASFTNVSGPVTFRFYGYNAEGTGGTFSLDNVAFTGTYTGTPDADNTSLTISQPTFVGTPSGGSSTQPVTLTNSSGTAQTAGLSLYPAYTATPFSLVDAADAPLSSIVVPANGTATAYVKFSPTTPGTSYNRIVAAVVGVQDVVGPLFSAVATAPATFPNIAVTQAATAYPDGGATAYDFGYQPQGGSTANVTFTITNSSTTDDLTISSITSSNPQYTLTGTVPTTVAKNNGTATFNVRFTPTAAGTQTSTLTINNNSSSVAGTNVYTVRLTGVSNGSPTITNISTTTLLTGITSSVLVQGTGFNTTAGATTVDYSGGTVSNLVVSSGQMLRVELTPTGDGPGNLTVTTAPATGGGTSAATVLTASTPPAIVGVFEPFELFATNGAANTTNYTTPATAFTQNSGAVTVFQTLITNTSFPIGDVRNNSQSARIRGGGYVEFSRTNGVGKVSLLAAISGFSGDNNSGGASFTVQYSLNGGAFVTVSGTPAAGTLPGTLTAYSYDLNQTGNVLVRIASTNTTVGSNPRINIDDVQINDFSGDLVISDTRAIAAGTYGNITIEDGGLGFLTGNIVVTGTLLIKDGGTLYTITDGGGGCHRVSGAGSFTLAAGGYLEICDAGGISLTGATGTIRTTGPRSFSDDASYDFTSEGPQVTGDGLPATVRELYSYNDDDVTLTQALAVRQLLDLVVDGDLQLNGQPLTLLSDENGTALVVNGSGGGKVVGRTATVQRYLTTENRGLGYRHYSAPVSGSTVADLATPGFTPQVSQAAAYNASATPGKITPFPTVFAYNQARVTMTSTYAPFDRGFVVPAGLGSTLEVGRGYAVQIAGTEKVAFTGTLNTGNYDVNLSRLPENENAGWALVGNPYPAPLDGGKLFDGNAPGLDQSFYVVESTGPYAGMYRAYQRNFEGGEQNPLIAAGQGFFVRVSSGEADLKQLQFRNSQRVETYATQVPMQRTASTQPTVGLALRGATGPADKLFVYAAAPATASFDSGYDAWKLSNTTGLNLSSRSATGEALSIDGRPAFTAATRIA